MKEYKSTKVKCSVFVFVHYLKLFTKYVHVYMFLQGTLTAEGKRKDIDRDFALLFTVMDENQSWYLDENIQKYCTEKGRLNTYSIQARIDVDVPSGTR